jgi:hypothetical protein
MIALIVTLAPVVPVAMSAPAAALALAALSLSFLVDIVWWFQNASQARTTVSPQ